MITCNEKTLRDYKILNVYKTNTYSVTKKKILDNKMIHIGQNTYYLHNDYLSF